MLPAERIDAGSVMFEELIAGKEPNAELTHVGPIACSARADMETSADVGSSDLVRRSVRRPVAKTSERQRRSA